ncbi:PTS sugar transporter subunit IIA [Mesobacillus stamsii]|uniref:PTS system mannose-specific IIA component n=1 Tax=Mesobacillus stamsii TaxID=225347 RepID=A0ABU0FQZ2_9BACI|nr:PTS sugar transporter subunit IIA [Mesobacillus stamsii]MDQ0412321.1 PTS system mannose-specific IIA component [Mesobacillus stamsii]
MIGIIIATHGKMSDGIIDAAELIIGSTDKIETLNLYQGDDVQDLNKQMLEAIKRVDQNEGILLFTDLFGASPYNQATLAIHSLPVEKQEQIFVLTGVNLPMVLEAINQRMIGTSIHETVTAVQNSGQQSMVLWPSEENNTDKVNDDF